MALDRTAEPVIPESIGPETEQAIREVFLSPRVIDRRVYDELSEALRSLIVRAGAEQRSLEQSRSDASKIGDRLDRASEDMKARLRTAARMLEALEERVTRAETAAKAAEERAATASAVVKRLEDQLAAKVAEAEKRLDASARSSEQRIAKAAEAAALHAGQVQEQFEQQSDRALEVLEQAGGAEERAAASVKRLETLAGDLQARFESQTDEAIALVLAEAKKAGPPTAAAKLAADFQERFEYQADAALAEVERARDEALARLGAGRAETKKNR